MIRLSISSIIWLLGFSIADIIDSSFDDIVVNLLLGGGGEGHIKITSSFSSFLFSFGETIGLTREREVNWLVYANDSCSSQIWLSITRCPWSWYAINSFTSIITKSWRLKDHSRWVFRKNSIEFSIRFDYLLILLYKWLCLYYYMITCSSRTFYDHMTLSCDMIT